MEYTYQYLKEKTKTIIGDKLTFKPKVKFCKWDDAHSFTLEIQGLGIFTPTVTVGKIDGKSVDKDFNITYTQTPVNPLYNDEGGLDIIITQGKVGLSNIINFTYSNDHVVGYLQPPLTPEEIAEGCVRPDHVVNSIAFYATDQGGIQAVGGIEWKTGKVGHLYRMKASSYDGKVDPVWCDWSISGNVVSLTIPIAWWNDTKTKFPITITPIGDTFGYTATGGSEGSIAADRFRSYVATPAGAGTGVSISVWTYAGYGANIKGVLVEATGLTIVANGVTGATADVDNNWTTCNFGTAPNITAQSYAIGFIPEAAVGVKYDTPGGNFCKSDNSNSYSTPTNPTDATDSTLRIAVYCTYTPSAGGWTGIAKVNGVAQAAILKVNGVAKAAIAKISGRAV